MFQFHKKSEERQVAEWWYYDAGGRRLICEVKHKNKPVLKRLTCKVTESEVENAWLAISIFTGESFLLWKDKQFSPENELVAEVDDWKISLKGQNKDGATFEEDLRLLIPIGYGSALAIGENRNRMYYLNNSGNTLL